MVDGLNQEDCGDDGGKHRPEAGCLGQGLQAAGGGGVFARDGGAVGEGAVDENCRGAVDLGDVDNRFVEGVVAAIADELVVVRGRVVVVASADSVAGAAANDIAGLVRPARRVVEAVRVIVVVHVRAVQPDAGPEGDGGAE